MKAKDVDRIAKLTICAELDMMDVDNQLMYKIAENEGITIDDSEAIAERIGRISIDLQKTDLLNV